MVFLFYSLLSLRYSGPTYLSDEASYLTKAAFLAGNTVDNASSWHAGYSLILAPLFLVFSETSQIWRSALILNSAMLIISSILLLRFLSRVFPHRRYRDVLIATMGCMLYPGVVAMSGYTFSGPFFLLVFMILVTMLMKVEYNKPTSGIAPAILGGFLYWIHPMGIAVSMAVFLALAVNSVYKKNYKTLLVYASISFATVLLYIVIIHPWINNGMTPQGFPQADHYGAVQSNIGGVTALGLLFRLPAFVMGQVAYLLVATYGILLISIGVGFGYVSGLVKRRTALLNEELVVFILVLSLVGIVLMGSFLFYLSSVSDVIRPDHLIYGRYAEMIILPLLGVGLLSPWNRRLLFVGSLYVGFTGLYLELVFRHAGSSDFNNLVNTTAFWPQYFYQSTNYLYLMMLGLLGVLISTVSKKLYMVLPVVLLSILCIYNQAQWHISLYNALSQPSGAVEYIQTLSDDTCVALSPEGLDYNQLETLVKYKYYLYRLEPRRVVVSSWRESDCEVLLTFDARMFAGDKGLMIGKELSTSLYVIVKRSSASNGERILKQYTNFSPVVGESSGSELYK